MSFEKKEFISYYEDHTFFDSSFPLTFHFDTCKRDSPFSRYLHWHENIEILYFTEGEGIVYLGAEEICAKKGDIVIVNSNILHGFDSVTEICKYHCLIVDKYLYESFGINAGRLFYNEIIKDDTAVSYYNKIIDEWSRKETFYKPAIKIYALELLLYLSRYQLDEKAVKDTFNDKRVESVKLAISYIRSNFKNEIAIDDVCKHIGLSKYYFSRIFKEITYKTPVEYINFVRCHNARNLIISGKYNVSESAELSGFKNLSYFSKTYKKFFGTLPSKKV